MRKTKMLFEYSVAAAVLLEQILFQFATNEPRAFEDLFFTYCFDDLVEEINKRDAVRQAFSEFVDLDVDTFWSLNMFASVLNGIIAEYGNVIFRVSVEV